MDEFRPLQNDASVTEGEVIFPVCESGAREGRGPKARTASPEEVEKLAHDPVLVSDFKQLKLEQEAQKNWDLFYKRNSTNFFKDRHWTTREFEELKSCREVSMFHVLSQPRVMEGYRPNVSVSHNGKSHMTVYFIFNESLIKHKLLHDCGRL